MYKHLPSDIFIALGSAGTSFCVLLACDSLDRQLIFFNKSIPKICVGT